MTSHRAHGQQTLASATTGTSSSTASIVARAATISGSTMLSPIVTTTPRMSNSPADDARTWRSREGDEEIDAIGAGDDVVHVSPFLSYLFASADEELVAGI
jgi:hypothetical protein